MQASVLCALASCLSPSLGEREAGEAAVAALELQPGYGGCLCDVIRHRSGVDDRLRHMAAIMLKAFLRRHWDAHAAEFEAPLIADADKQAIRTALASAEMLCVEHSRIRTAVGLAVAVVAEYDLPQHQWNALLHSLVSYINSNDVPLVRGALECLVLLVEEVDAEQLPLLATAILPALLSIAANGRFYQTGLRMRAVRIFHSFVDAVLSTDDRTLRHLIADVVAQWMAMFTGVITLDITSRIADIGPRGTDQDDAVLLGLETEIWCTIYALMSCPCFLRQLVAHLPTLLNAACNWTHSLLPIYVTNVVSNSSSSPLFLPIRNDTGSAGVPSLVEAMFSVISVLSKKRSGRSPTLGFLRPVLGNIFYVAIGYSQISAHQSLCAADDANAVCFDEYEADGYSLRGTCYDIVSRLLAVFDSEAVAGVANACLRQCGEAEAARRVSHTAWWALQEASLFIFSLVMQKSSEDFDERHSLASVDVVTPFRQLVLPALSSPSMFVRTRSIHCAGYAANFVPVDVLHGIITAVVEAMHSQHAPLRFSGARSFGLLCCHEHVCSAVWPVFNDALGCLCESIAGVSCDDGPVLRMLLGVLQVALALDTGMAFSLQSTVVPILVEAWNKFSNDRHLISCVLDIFQILANAEQSLRLLQQQCLPVLMDILSCKPDAAPGVTESAVEVLKILLGEGCTVPNVYISSLLPKLLKMLSNTLDSSTIASGCDCLCAFIRTANVTTGKESHQIQQISLALVCLLGRLLGSELDDSATSNVGTLALQVLSRFQLDNESIAKLLQALVRRLYRAERPDLVIELVLVFAKLVHANGEQFVACLTDMGTMEMVNCRGGVDRINSLEHVLKTWIATTEDLDVTPFFRKVSLSALAKILSLGSTSVASVQTRGYQYVDVNAKRRTRSSKAISAVQYSLLPVPTKIISVLAQAWASLTQKNQFADGLPEEVDSEESFEDEAYDPGFPIEVKDLRDMRSDVDEIEDSTCRNDPLNMIDLRSFIVEFFQSFARDQSAMLQAFSEALRQDDKVLLTSIVNGPIN